MKQAPVWIQRSLVAALLGCGLWLLLARGAGEGASDAAANTLPGAAARMGGLVMIAVLVLGLLIERERASSTSSAAALAREALLAARTSEVLRSLVVHARGVVLVSDVDDQLVVVCPLAARVFGLEAAQCVGQPARAVLPAQLADLLLGGPAGASQPDTADSQTLALDTLQGRRTFRVESGLIRSHGGVRQGRFIFACDEGEARRAAASSAPPAAPRRADADRWIARRIHDDIGQPIALVQLQIERCLQDLVPPRAAGLADALRAAASQLENAAHRARRIMAEPGAAALEQRGLVSAARRHVQDLRPFFEMGRLVFTAEPSAEAARWPRAVEEEMFDILREALSNAMRHARAGAIEVRIEGDAQRLAVSVQDDGRGIDSIAEPPPGSVGMASMRERAASIGARLTIASARPAGTQVAAVWQVPPDGTYLHH